MNRIELADSEWELWEKPDVQFKPRNMPPICGIMPSGLYLNRTAMEIIGRDKNAVVFYLSKDKTKIGMWFFKDKSIVSQVRGLNAGVAYSVVKHPRNGTARISCAKFVEDNKLRERTLQLGRVSFPIIPDREEKQPDFYVVELK